MFNIEEELKKLNLDIITDNLVYIEDELIRHDLIKLTYYIYSKLIRG